MTGSARHRLEEVLRAIGPLTVAVSGGVDSLTLAALGHRELGSGAAMVHAASPAVPDEATARSIQYPRWPERMAPRTMLSIVTWPASRPSTRMAKGSEVPVRARRATERRMAR